MVDHSEVFGGRHLRSTDGVAFNFGATLWTLHYLRLTNQVRSEGHAGGGKIVVVVVVVVVVLVVSMNDETISSSYTSVVPDVFNCASS